MRQERCGAIEFPGAEGGRKRQEEPLRAMLSADTLTAWRLARFSWQLADSQEVCVVVTKTGTLACLFESVALVYAGLTKRL